jgi:Predicted transcriptional regulators
MNLSTISEISKKLSISTRTLRYYEQIGLIESIIKEDYAYRTYDEAAVTRLQQIIVLRKLRIPLKQIAMIIKSQNTVAIIDAFQQNLAEVDDEITALSTIRDIINSFISRLKESIQQDIKLNLLDDTALLEAVDALTVQRLPLKEEKTAADLEQASEKLNRLTDRDVRIIYLTPMTVASIHIVGQDTDGNHAELLASSIIDDFIKKSNLKEIYPAARSFGFNNPDGVDDNDPAHGYERWISIPDDMEVPAPLVKKHLDGGTYAAHMIPMGAWDEGWLPLHNWVDNNDRFEFRWETIDGVCGWLEEHLNYWEWDTANRYNRTNQFDLLLPIKPKFAATTKHPQENIINTFKYNDMPVEVVEWDDTIWCGRMESAKNCTDEPDMGRVSDDFLAQDRTAIINRLETAANTLLHFDFLTTTCPAVAMFAFLVGTEEQPDGFDVKRVPAGRYMRLPLTSESAKALGVEPWNGGRPPIEWISERLAPQFRYMQVFDLPFIEYYGYLNGSSDEVVNAFLYVPVEKI